MVQWRLRTHRRQNDLTDASVHQRTGVHMNRRMKEYQVTLSVAAIGRQEVCPPDLCQRLRGIWEGIVTSDRPIGYNVAGRFTGSVGGPHVVVVAEYIRGPAIALTYSTTNPDRPLLTDVVLGEFDEQKLLLQLDVTRMQVTASITQMTTVDFNVKDIIAGLPHEYICKAAMRTIRTQYAGHALATGIDDAEFSEWADAMDAAVRRREEIDG